MASKIQMFKFYVSKELGEKILGKYLSSGMDGSLLFQQDQNIK